MKPKQTQTYLIYLIGKSGVGKYTVAQALEKHGFILCDNQLINYPIFSLLKYDGITPIPESAWDAIAEIRHIMYEFISHESIHNYVLTNVLGEIPQDHKILASVERLAQKRHSVFIPVKMNCAIDENIKRIQNPERTKRYKSIDVQDVYSQHIIYITHPNLLELDVTSLKPEKIAEHILGHANSIGKAYPPEKPSSFFINTPPVSTQNATHFTWGDQCDGWWLKNTGKFTVISESMPPDTTEKKHYHNITEQFFYCLSGELSIQVGTQEYTLQEHEGLEIAAAQEHKVQNKSKKIVQFLVISSPNSHEDRVDLE